jgi:hypothetical protein
MLLKNAIMQTADTVLDRMERVTYTDWFDAECEQATRRKNLAYKRMQQRNQTRKDLLNTSSRNWNASGVTMKANPSIEN